MIVRLLLISFVCCLTACKPHTAQSKLEQIKQQNQLTVGILFNPSSYYIDTEGGAGFEHDLVQEFAKYLDVNLNLVPNYHVDVLLKKLKNGQIDLLVGGLNQTEQRSQNFRFSPAYQYISYKLVYKQGRERPKSLSEITEPITVTVGTSHYELLNKLKQDFPNLVIEATNKADPNELLEMVMANEVAYTVADSHNLALVRRYYPDLSVALTLDEQQPLSWLFEKNNDDSLYAVLIDFFGEMHKNGELTALEEQYFGHVESFNYVDTRLFMQAVDKTLPKFQSWFQQYSGDIDWRLLAAQSYQESHWNPRAISPTGVRGIMMLTQPTAKQMGVKSRLDAESNIRGGAQYLQTLLDRIPDRIEVHDKPWFALAAYNIGWGHVEDARKLTQRLGGDPDKWVDVKHNLPLLRQKTYYKTTRYGFARGDEAVTYVTNIRRYYDTLLWLDSKEQQATAMENKKTELLINSDSGS